MFYSFTNGVLCKNADGTPLELEHNTIPYVTGRSVQQHLGLGHQTIAFSTSLHCSN